MGRTFYTNRKRIEKISESEKLDLMLDMIYAFGIVKKPDETAVFLQDLLTSTEIRNLSFRLRIAKLLLAGLTFEDIQDRLHVSSATITKVSLWLEQGGDGFKNVISKLPIKWEKPKRIPRGPIEFRLPEILTYIAEYKLSQRGVKTAKKLLTGMDSKGVLDRSLGEANKYLYMDKAGENKKIVFRNKISSNK